jgi:surfactin synthase thioesterase subunit
MSKFFFAHAIGFPSRCYQPFFNELEKSGHLIDFIEKIGLNPKHPITNNWPHLVEELANEIRSRHNEPVVGIGHSAGGLITYLVARKYPELFSQILVLDAPTINGPQNIPWWILKRIGLSDMVTPAKHSKHRRTYFESLEQIDELRDTELLKEVDDASFASYVKHGFIPDDKGGFTLAFPLETELALFRSAPDDLWRYKEPLAMKGIYISAEGSEFSTLPFAERLCEKAEMDYHVLKGNHMFPMEHPKTSAKFINQWLTENS